MHPKIFISGLIAVVSITTAAAQKCGSNAIPLLSRCGNGSGLELGRMACDSTCNNIVHCYRGYAEQVNQCYPGRCIYNEKTLSPFCIYNEKTLSPFCIRMEHRPKEVVG
ncbi:hypothetical protein VM1G_09734 [Cytospora mali]|uniref:Uncharacterized protein n=1 Tax=Cytospora mali TaxID=578113 RepID=A0A194WD16_CYTMA|nr:hypothetical protein VM1G_09734 [Valsa mali]